MSLPELLSGAVGDESVVADVPLGGDDVLAVTPTRTLVYRGDGLLSDESVEEYGHGVERIAVSTGRRKSKLVLGYGLDGDETLSIPTGRVDDVLHPVLAGVLSATGVTESGESILRTFRFSELTLVITDRRLVKHVGSAVWDEEFEEFPYADLTDLDFEEGTVATAVVLAHGGRSERFKAPNESARAVRETLVDAVCSFHDVGSLEEFRVAVADEDEDDAEEPTGTTDFGEGPDPLSTSPAADASDERSSPHESAMTDDTASSVDRSPSSPDQPSSPDRSSLPDQPSSPDRSSSPDQPSSTADEFRSSDDPPSTTADPTRNPDPARSGETPAGGATAGGDATEAPPTADEVAGSGDTAGTDPLADPFDTGTQTGSPDGTVADADADAGSDGAAARSEPAGSDGFDGSAFESAGIEEAELVAEVADLRRTVEAQGERLDRQSELIERLIEELRRGR